MYRATVVGATAVCILSIAAFAWNSVSKVGAIDGRKFRVPTGQVINPEGTLTVIDSRPVDLVLSPDGSRAFVKETKGITVIGLPRGEVVGSVSIPGAASLTGLTLSEDGKKLYTSNSGNAVIEVDVSEATPRVLRTMRLPAPKVGGQPFPCGLARRGNSLYIAANRSNQVLELNLENGSIIRTIAVPPAPFDLALHPTKDELWVSCWGRTPDGGPSAPSSGTPVHVDSRGIAVGGTLARIELETGSMNLSPLGAQPGSVVFRNNDAYIPIANGDQVTRIRNGVAEPFWKAPLGSAPSDVAVLPDGGVAVTLGGANEVIVLTSDGKPKERYRSAWYPLSVQSRDNKIIVASAKGFGSRGLELSTGKLDGIANTKISSSPIKPDDFVKKGVYQFTGAISVIPRDGRTSTIDLAKATPKPRSNVKPVAVPVRTGEPSVFKHVIYVLKENRTYDQVFGDLPQGDGDPALCIYPEQVTPNHHSLAREFVLLDNYYCNGVLSADGHSWSTEGNVTGYFERSFGGWTRSYPYGDDPLAISVTGHIWDAVLAKGKTFRNYGEYNYSTPTKNEKYPEILKDFQSGARKIKFKHSIGIEKLRKLSHPDCPGWNMEIPDILRADYFIKDLKVAEKTGKFANFNFVYLPQDHTSGLSPNAPSPRACVADNDLALGRIVDAVSKSKFWKETVIFVIEDDPQDGFDHVDGHRSICLVVSPYTRRGAVVSEFYNQTAVLKTMRHILGLPLATSFESDSNLMMAVFTNKPNLKPYTVRPNQIPLDELNPAQSNRQALDLSRPDMNDDHEFNLQHWIAAKGNATYPKELAGAHGTGLRVRGLKLGKGIVREED
jgi:DNA-binding beta-propeller fold protein YncE